MRPQPVQQITRNIIIMSNLGDQALQQVIEDVLHANLSSAYPRDKFLQLMLSLNPAILTLYEEDYKTTSPDLVSPQTFLWLRLDPLRHSGHILATCASCVWSWSRSRRWTRRLKTSSPSKECTALSGWSTNPSGQKECSASSSVPFPSPKTWLLSCEMWWAAMRAVGA